MIELLGMEWRTAVGEAEAELAAMNERGEIDAVISDDVDTLLFGARLVIRNESKSLSQALSKASAARKAAASSTDSPRKQPTSSLPLSSQPSSSATSPNSSSAHEPVPAESDRALLTWSSEDVLSKTGLARHHMILIALMSGGDYSSGIDRVGPLTARRLAKIGFAERLLDGIKRLSHDPTAHEQFMNEWREDVAEVLTKNPDGVLERKAPALAKKILDSDFPNLKVVKNYVEPKVSKRGSQRAPTWDNDIDVEGLIAFVTTMFEWGNEQIQSSFRMTLWLGIFMRRVRRTALARDTCSNSESPASALVQAVIEHKCAQSTDFVPAYSLHLDQEAFDALIKRYLPPVDPFPFPRYEDYPEEEAERLRLARKASGRKVERPKPPTTSDYRHWVPCAFVLGDEGCLDLVEEWKDEKRRRARQEEEKLERQAERARAKAEGRASPVKRSTAKANEKQKKKREFEGPANDSDPDEVNSAQTCLRLQKEKAEKLRMERIAVIRAAKEAQKKGGEGKGKEKAARGFEPSAITRTVRPPSPDSDLEIIEPAAGPSRTRLCASRASTPSGSNLASAFTASKSTVTSQAKKSSPSSTLAFSSSKPFGTIPPKRPAPTRAHEPSRPSQSGELSLKHVDKASRSSRAQTSPSKQPKATVLELVDSDVDSGDTSSDDLESLDVILARRQKQAAIAGTRKIGPGPKSQGLQAGFSSTSLSSQRGGGPKGKDARRQIVETIVLDSDSD